MTNYPDPEIVGMQTAWLERHRGAHRWIIVRDLDGWEVHEHTIDGVAPCSTYPTVEEAAARLLQLLGIKTLITPQSWPECVCISQIEPAQDGGRP